MNETSIPIEVRSETADDQKAIWNVNHRAFGQRDEADLVDGLRTGGYLHASSVALIDDDVVGHALLSVGRVGEAQILVLAPVAVIPHQQGIGIGTAVISHVLESAADGVVTVLGDPAYYRRFGFEAAEPFGIKAPFPVERGALQLIRPKHVPAGIIEYAEPFNGL